MNKKQLLTLCILFLAIASLAIFQRYVDGNTYTPKTEKMVSFSTGMIDKIILTSADKEKITLTKTGNVWEITTPLTAKADNKKISDLLTLTKDIELTNVVSTNKDKYAQFQVNETGTHVELFQNNEKKLGFFVGKIAEDYAHSYLRKDTEEKTYLAKGLLQSTFGAPLLSLRDTSITKLSSEDLQEIIVKTPTKKSTLSKKEGKWIHDGKKDLTDENIKNILTPLMNLQASSIKTGKEKEREEILANQDVKIFMRRSNQDLKSIVLYLKKGENTLLLVQEESQDIYEISPSLLQDLEKLL